MNSRASAVRCMVIGINVLYLLAGIAAVAVGLWLFFTRYEIWKFGEFAKYSESESLHNFWLADIILVAGGVAVIVFGFSGVCGVFAKNSCMWGFQAFCFLLTIAVHIAAIVFVVESYMQHERTQSPMKLELFQKYDGVGSNEYTQWLNKVQEKYECCGASGVIDYTADITSFKLFSRRLGTLRNMPPSSCLDTNEGVAHTRVTPKDVLSLRDEEFKFLGVVRVGGRTRLRVACQQSLCRGCHESMKEALHVEYISILVISSVTVFCAVLLFVLSICLCVRYKEKAIVTHL